MSDSEHQPAKRGDAAWKESLQAITERNDEARKAGKQKRQAYDDAKALARQQAERTQMEALRKVMPPS